jgi:glycine betaine/proline transport system permease protein
MNKLQSFIAQLKSVFDIGTIFENIVEWLTANFGALFDLIRHIIATGMDALNAVLLFPHPLIMILVLTAIAWFVVGRGVGIFTFLGFLLILYMELWGETINTLSLILTAVFIALLIGIPLGIWVSKNDVLEALVRPVLDFMQTLPPFVYLIPAVMFFSIGMVPGVVATFIFAMPPAVRLTNLGIRQVPTEIKEASQSFGANPMQLLFKAELPVALKSILAGINQTIMLALSMVVIAGMIGAPGLGDVVVRGIQTMDLNLGFEGGISIVILAIFLDRITQGIGELTQKQT